MAFRVTQIKPTLTDYVRRYPNVFANVNAIDGDWFDEILCPVFSVAKQMYGPAPSEPSHADRILDGSNYRYLNRPNEPEPTIVKARTKFNLLEVINTNLAGAGVINPDATQLWSFTKHTPLDDVKVIVCGQNPHCKNGVADGLAHSSQSFVTLNLQSIFEAIRHQLHVEPDARNGNLKRWARQGVLLCNAILSSGNEPLSHARIGWIELMSMIIYAVCLRRRLLHCYKIPTLAWGQMARRFVRGPTVLDSRDFRRLHSTLVETWQANTDVPFSNASPQNVVIDDSVYIVMQSIHPSPLAARHNPTGPKFKDNNHFTEVDKYFVAHGMQPVDWR